MEEWEDLAVATKKIIINKHIAIDDLGIVSSMSDRTLMVTDEGRTVYKEKVEVSSIGKTTEALEILKENIETAPSSSYLNYDMNVPTNSASKQKLKADTRTYEYDVSMFYNYYAPQYEREIQDVEEHRIPNYYVSLKNGHRDGKEGSRHFSNNRLSPGLFKQLIARHKSNLMPRDDLLVNKTKNIIFMNSTPDGNNISSKYYPFGVTVDFDCFVNKTEVSSLIKELGILNGLGLTYQNSTKEMMNVTAHYVEQVPSKPSAAAPLGGTTTSNLRMPYTNIMTYIDQNPIISNFDLPNTLVHGSEHKNSIYGSYLKTGLLKSFLNKKTRDHSISFADAASGKKVYSEVLFYKIDKFIGASRSTPIQTFYLPAGSVKNKIIDTQARYGGRYHYSVSAISIVIGSDFVFKKSHINQNTKKIELELENYPYAYLTEMEMFSESVVVACPPPPRPQVMFYTKNNSTNDLYIRMSISEFTRYEPFTLIEGVDNLQTAKMVPSGVNSDKYKFKYMGGKNKYDVYRLSKPPNSYDDFAGKKYLENVIPSVRSTMMIMDRVKSNKKYYYMFRSVNDHGLKSNPSTIYEVELIKDADSSKVEVNSYKFPNFEATERTVSMKRFFQIIPAAQHTIFDPTPDFASKHSSTYKNSLSDVVLGTADNPIWGRKFKIRVTSNDTGRKIDINVLFNLIKKKGNEDLI